MLQPDLDTPPVGFRENSAMRVIVGAVYLSVSSSMVQRLHKFIHSITNHDYQPLTQPPATDVTKTDDVTQGRKILSEAELKELEEFALVRTTHLTLLKPHVCLYYNDLPPYDATKTTVKIRGQKNV